MSPLVAGPAPVCVHLSNNNDNNNNDNNNAPSVSILYLGEGYRLTQIPVKVSTTYMRNKWFGLSLFKDMPIVGGILEMNWLRKNNWRIGYLLAETKQYSRFELTLESMVTFKEHNCGGDDATFFYEMDELFPENNKLSLFQKNKAKST